VNHQEPKPPAGGLERPAELSPAAAAIWDRVVSGLAPIGILTPVDIDAVVAYCETVAFRGELVRLLAGSGPLIRGARAGELVKNPLVAMIRDTTRQMIVLGRELGLSPSARVGLRAPDGGAPGSRLEAFLAQNRRAG
jgi:P27 family predicted phage terminase small subunit